MIQRHSIILWKRAEKKDKDFEEIAKETYEILKLFQECPQELRPKGSYVIVDDITKEIVQIIDNINPSIWAPDSGIIDPYIPD